MKYTKLFLSAVFALASCAAPATPTSTQTFTPEPTSDVNAIAAASVTPDLTRGNIEGNLSWSVPATSDHAPISNVNLEINGHSGNNPRYTTSADPNGHFIFANIEMGDYGFGIYFNLPISKRLCDNPEFQFDTDLDWLHYATALKGDLWFDIIFSNKDVVVNAGEVVVLNFVLKCP